MQNEYSLHVISANITPQHYSELKRYKTGARSKEIRCSHPLLFARLRTCPTSREISSACPGLLCFCWSTGVPRRVGTAWSLTWPPCATWVARHTVGGCLCYSSSGAIPPCHCSTAVRTSWWRSTPMTSSKSRQRTNVGYVINCCSAAHCVALYVISPKESGLWRRGR